ncbi:MAG TPA: uroporphyrinogen-III C-methyltransferase [bacterium]|nr:uroporphyrinogen-III C-methyltransferase [bacterium]
MSRALGKVVLVGAGPGDEGLLTVRGKAALERAQVVVYDLLANPKLLELAPASARRINAGKRAGKHVLTQDQTNALLVRLARQGLAVVRLKGGDPYVFGRGGEEALALRAAKVPFEVVPGISSGVAALAYAGIPLTHRGLATSAVFVTGQERTGKPLQARTLKALAQLDATLVFFMATGAAARVCAQLVKAGKPASTPAACVMNGTRPNQRTLVSTLGKLAQDMAQGGFGAPGLLVVGPVAGLKRQLGWFEERPLFGRRYVVTRSREQASLLSGRLRELGAEVTELPAIALKALPLDAAMRRALAGLAKADWAVFSSANGVEHFFARLFEGGLDARALSGVRLAAVGKSTADALQARGLRADLVPENFDADHLLKSLLPKLAKSGPRRAVLLARAQEGRTVLLEGLKARKVPVLDLPLYRTVAAAQDVRDVAAALAAGKIDGVTFSSSSTVTHFQGLFSRAEWQRLAPGVPAMVLGPITRATALEAGLTVSLEAKEASIPALVQAVLNCHGR